MNGKNFTAGLLVSFVSVALAVGITYVVANSGSRGLVFETPRPIMTNTLPATNLAGMVDPQASQTVNPGDNCTFPIENWLGFPDAWRIDSYRIGPKVYSKSEMIDILRRNSNDLREKMLAQMFIVVLNQQNGADVTGISDVFNQAADWLLIYPQGTTAPDNELKKTVSITNTLEKFNNGQLGPAACNYPLANVTPVPIFTLAVETTTPTMPTLGYITLEPSWTPQTGNGRPDPPRKVVPPTATPIPPTPVPPTPVPPTPTDIPPVPTAVPTSLPPTTAPTTAATQPPAPTVAPTSPPPQPTTASQPTPVPTTEPTSGSGKPTKPATTKSSASVNAWLPNSSGGQPIG